MDNLFREITKHFSPRTQPVQLKYRRKCRVCRGKFDTNEKGQKVCGDKCRGGEAMAKRKQLQRVDYYQCISSPAWRKRADACKDKADHRCQVCNRGAGVVRLEAHHRTYERLGRELPEDLIALCEDCHELFSKQGRLAKYSGEKP